MSILFLSALCICVQAQNIAGLVLDADTKEPLANVFIFIANSSVGTTTANDGTFKLPIDEPVGTQIFLSHLGYDILAIKYEGEQREKKEVFYLVPTDLSLEETVVVAKAQPGLRRRRLRDFREAFLGEVSASRVQIENPETILFEEKDDRLIATVSEPLYIENKELGYIVQFYLASFEQWGERSVDYQGSAYFVEMEGKRSQEARFRKNRKQAYKKSSMKFFRALASDNYSDYQVGVSLPGPDNSFDHFSKLDTLSIRPGKDGQFLLEVNGCLTVIDQSVPAQSNTSRQKASSELSFQTTTIGMAATSYLCPKNARILFTQNGRILNASEVEEFGYWTTQRVGSLLPFGYKP